MDNELIIEIQDLTKDYYDGGNVIQALKAANIKIFKDKSSSFFGQLRAEFFIRNKSG